MLSWLAALQALFPLIGKLIDLFTKTPEQRAADKAQADKDKAARIHDAINEANKTKGNTSKLEKEIGDL